MVESNVGPRQWDFENISRESVKPFFDEKNFDCNLFTAEVIAGGKKKPSVLRKQKGGLLLENLLRFGVEFDFGMIDALLKQCQTYE